MQLIQDYEDYDEVNKQLDKMSVTHSYFLLLRTLAHEVCGRGYNMGIRLIEDFLARSNVGRCSDFRDVGECVSKVQSLQICVFRLCD